MQPQGVLPIAPSAIAPEGHIFTSTGKQRFVIPRALETEEIEDVVNQFSHAARLGLEAGFDGVDIHAANGYLIDQFLRDGTNCRADAYGGSVANRARFLLEVVEAACAIWGASRVGVRISPLNPYNGMHDSNPQGTFGYVAAALGSLNIGYLHVVEPGPGHPLETTAGLELLQALRISFSGFLLVDGGRDRYSAERALSATSADLVALATPFIANPDLVERLARGLPLAPADSTTFYTGAGRGYTDYPTHSEEMAATAGLPSRPEPQIRAS
jgi:N-ethylmaleimide reductase